MTVGRIFKKYSFHNCRLFSCPCIILDILSYFKKCILFVLLCTLFLIVSHYIRYPWWPWTAVNILYYDYLRFYCRIVVLTVNIKFTYYYIAIWWGVLYMPILIRVPYFESLCTVLYHIAPPCVCKYLHIVNLWALPHMEQLGVKSIYSLQHF